jgi:hypothetical protein
MKEFTMNKDELVDEVLANKLALKDLAKDIGVEVNAKLHYIKLLEKAELMIIARDNLIKKLRDRLESHKVV